MANTVDTLALDATQMIAELARLQQQFNTYNSAVGQSSDVALNLRRTTQGLAGTFKEVSSAGYELSGRLKQINGEWETSALRIKQTTEALKELRTQQNLQKAQAGATQAEAFLKASGLGTQQTIVPSQFQNTLRAAQQQLVKALGDEPFNLQIAKSIFSELQKGVVDVEVGIRGKIQQALIGVLRIQERITAEQQKQAKAANPAPSSGATAQQLSAFRSGILGAFPVPTQASIGSVISFQAALNTLIATAARGKITFSDLQQLFQNVQRNPLGDFSGGNKDLAQAQVAIQRVIQAHQAMTRSAKEAEDQGKKSGRSLYVSFSEFMRLLEIQIIHRAFGALLTGMQQSIGTAADLQIRISEIRTVSQSAGIGFVDMQARVRALSEEFGRPQLDIAEAIYQGFSNQVIRTVADMSIMNEVMRLSRITVTDASSAMELMSSVLKSYGLANFEAAQVTDQLFKAIEIGRFRAQDIANSLGRVTVVAADAGVKLEEVLGLLANLTRRGVSPNEAMTQISAIMQALIRPSEGMRKLLMEWGVDSGVAAVQTFGFVEVLRRLAAEANSSGNRIGELFNNVRALRGIIGATSGGGGTGQLETDISQITGGREQAANAAAIVSESAGDRFRKELIKIQNFFINDFANTFLQQMEMLTSKAGGLSNMFKEFGRAVLDITGVLVQFIAITQNVLSIGGTLNVDLGTLVKAFLLYKATVIGVSIAHGVATAAVAVYSGWKLTLTAILTANTVASNLSWASIWLNVQAMVAGTISSITYAAGLLKMGAGKLFAAAASRVLAVAMASIPFIALGLAIAYVIGLLDPFKQKIQETERVVSRFRQMETNFGEQFRREREQTQREETEALNRFRTQLDERVQMLSRAMALIRRQSTSLVDEQRRAVEASTEKVKEAADGVKTAMSDIVSAIKRNITDAEANIKHSLAQTSKFADRTAAETFQRSLKAAGLQPVIQSGLRPISYEQQEVEQLQRQGRRNAFDQQQELIQRRIATLTREGNELSMRGDRDSMDSARRKYQEVRQLSEQLFELQTNESRTRATDVATDTARLTGGIVRSTFSVNLRAFNEMMDQITQRETEAEERFRAAQARREAEERTRLENARQAQSAVNRTLQDMMRFRITNEQGDLLERFRGPQGLQRMQADWEALNGRLETALRNSPLDPSAYAQLQVALNSQRLAMEGQIQRQLLDMRIAGTQQWLQNERQAIEALRREGADMRQQGLELQRVSITQLTGRIAAMGQQLAGSQFQGQFTTASNQLTQALSAYEQARGTVNEGVALQTLQDRIRALADIYRRFLLSFGENIIPGINRTGRQEAGITLDIENVSRNLQVAYDQIGEGAGKIVNAETRLRNLNLQIQLLPAGLQAAAANVNQLGDAAQNQIIRVQNLANVMRELADQVDRLRQPGQAPAIPGNVDLRDLAAMAQGGLLGGMFSSRGPDDMIIKAKRGEFIVNPESSQRFYTQLTAINRGKLPSFAQGGMVGNSTVGDVTINVDGSKSPETTGRAVLRVIKRQIRRGNGSLS